MNRDRIQVRWRRLVELASLHPPWLQQLEAYAPPSLARCLVASDDAVERLARVLELNMQGSDHAAKFKRVSNESTLVVWWVQGLYGCFCCVIP